MNEKAQHDDGARKATETAQLTTNAEHNNTTFSEELDVSHGRHNLSLPSMSLHNDTWANTVPVSKKEKSCKMQNWRAAGRAIRKMLTKGILPTRSAEPCRDKAESVSSNKEVLSHKPWTRSHCSETEDGMNEMYNEFERSHTDPLSETMCDFTRDGHMSLTNEEQPQNLPTVSSNLEFNDNCLNGTVSSVLNSLGVTDNIFKSPAIVPVNLSFDSPTDSPKETSSHHSATSLSESQCSKLKEAKSNIGTEHCGVKRNSNRGKEPINWTDLKERLSRLTQKSFKRPEEKSAEKLKGSQTKHRNSSSSGTICKDELLHCKSTVSKSLKTKTKYSKDYYVESSSDEDCTKASSATNNIKTKHKHSIKHKHGLTHASFKIDPDGSTDNTKNNLVHEFQNHDVPSSGNKDLYSFHNVLTDNIWQNDTDTSSQVKKSLSKTSDSGRLDLLDAIMHPVNPAVTSSHASDLTQPCSNTRSQAFQHSLLSSTREKRMREIWDDRPILTAAGLTDSNFQDEGFEEQTEFVRALPEVTCAGDDPTTHDKLDINEGTESNRQSSGVSNESEISDTIRESTDDFAGTSSNLESQSDCELVPHSKETISSNNGPDSTHKPTDVKLRSGSRNQKSDASADESSKNLALRRDITSMCSAADVTSSKENLAECCEHSGDEICECVLQFIDESYHVTSSMEEEADFSDGVCTGGSVPQLLSSSSEEELAAQILLEKYKKDQLNRRKRQNTCVPDLVDTDESDFYDDIPEIEIPGSDGEKDEPVELSPREIQSLPELLSSSECSSGSEADDEFECECGMCQGNTLFAAHNRFATGWVTEEEEETFGTESENAMSVQYHDEPDIESFGFNVSELNPFDLLVMRQGRRDILEVMFQNVILQMLAVYPELLNDQAPPPLDPVDLDKIPVVSISSSHIEKEASCPICLCEFEHGEAARQIACQHIFHKLCIEAWLVKSGTCPVCRLVLNTKPADENAP